MHWIIGISVLVFFEFVADIFAKEWSLAQHKWVLAAGALLAYMIASTFWLLALKNGSGLMRGTVIFAVSSALVATVLGIFLYHEPLTRLQMIGVLFGFVSLVLIFWQ